MAPAAITSTIPSKINHLISLIIAIMKRMTKIIRTEIQTKAHVGSIEFT